MFWKSPLSQSTSDSTTLFTSSHFKLSIHVLNSTIYQKEIKGTDYTSAGYQLLVGNLILSVYKDTKINDIQVQFGGHTFEPVFEVALGDHIARKKIENTRLVNEKSIWNVRSVLVPGIYTYSFTFVVNPLLPESLLTKTLLTKYWIAVDLEYKTLALVKSIHHEYPINIVRSLPNDLALYSEPIIATGNWRDMLVYEFHFLSKFAFQGQPYTVTLNVYPIGGFNYNFRIFNLSVQLIQRTSYHVKSGYGVNSKKYSETQTVLLFKKNISFYDMYHASTPGGYMHFENEVPMPRINELQSNVLDMSSKEYIFPSTSHDNTSGMVVSHALKASFEVVEVKEPELKTLPPFRRSSCATSCSLGLSKSTTSSETAVPAYSTFHESKDVSKYKKVELSFSAPILLLSCQSIHGSISPPAYASELNGPSFSEHMASFLKKLERKTKDVVSQLPPQYNLVSPQ